MSLTSLSVVVDDAGNLRAGKLSQDGGQIVGILSDQLVDVGLEKGGQAALHGRDELLELEERQAGIAQRLHERVDARLQLLLEVGLRVRVAVEYVLERLLGALEDLVELVALDARALWRGRELAHVELRALHERVVVDLEARYDRAELEHAAGALHVLDGAAHCGAQLHEHLHHLDLGIHVAGVEVLTVVDAKVHELAGGRRAQHGRIVLLVEDARLDADGDAVAGDILHEEGEIAGAVEVDEQAAVGEPIHLHLHIRVVHDDDVVGRAALGHLQLVLVAVVDELHVHARAQAVERQYLAALEIGLIGGELVRHVAVGHVQRGAHEREHDVGPLGPHLVGDELVEPAGVEAVAQERLGLEQLDDVLDGGAEVAAYAELLEREDHVFARDLARLAPREAVAELRVGELVQAAARRHAEVAPHVAIRAERQLGDRARRRLEALVRILARDARRDHVAFRYWSFSIRKFQNIKHKLHLIFDFFDSNIKMRCFSFNHKNTLIHIIF